MAKSKPRLTQEELKKLLHYDPETGIFTWLVDRTGTALTGTIAGTIRPDGYRIIRVYSVSYRAHRLAHLYMEGYMPEHDMDHRLGIRDDNRWSEIRHTTRSCNQQNTKIRATNKSGFPGISWFKETRKWRSCVVLNNKQISLGYYENIVEAALARFTFEEQCSKWTCNYRSELVKAIREVWPEFQPKEELSYES